MTGQPKSAAQSCIFAEPQPSANWRRAATLGTASLLASAWSGAAFAQPEQPPQQTAAETTRDDDEIVVTARKREESILKVPVVMTAVSDETLETFQITTVTDLPRLVPGLVIAGNLLSIGPQVTIRGVGTSSFDPGVDQSVSLNIDGLSLGQGLAFGSGMFDVAQVEVLKGPQALFFGKSSPGGVISLRTNDPTERTEAIVRAGYEFYAREARAELIFSGPLTETLGGRLAIAYSNAEGWWKNNAVPILGTGAAAPHDRDSNAENLIIRGTLLWRPNDKLSARLKLNHVFDKTINAELKQLAGCPDGPGQAFGFGGIGPLFGLSPVDPIPFIGGDDCVYNREANQVYLDPQFFPGIPNGGIPYLQNKQRYGTLELNYDITPDLTLTSVTAYYKLVSSSSVNPTLTTAAGPTFAVTNNFRRRELTQELRLNSDFSGAFNFTLGGFFEDGQLFDRVRFIRNRAYGFISPAFIPGGLDILNDDRATTVNIKTYSLFGQLRFRPTEQLELAAGARWTDETRTESVFDFQNNVDLTPTLAEPRVHSSTISPEATITWTPTDDLTVFASYKKGFKSGSFKVAVPPVAGEDNAFDDEKVQGYEIGVKSRWFDRSLLMNVAFYDYRYKGLQVGGIADAVGGVPVITTVNAGSARTYGVDLDLAYHPPAIEGLSVNASVNWNRARYKELTNIPCYANQTFAQGCTTIFSPLLVQTPPPPAGPPAAAPAAIFVPGQGWGFFTGQNLSGAQMIRAPKWSINFGFDYEMPIGSGMKLQITNNNQFSSKYPSFLAVGRPNDDNFQRSFFKIDASVALKGREDRWEVALIGKNLTNKLVASNCAASNTAGGIFLGGANTGGAFPGGMGWAEKLCFPDGPGRQVWVRATFRPFN